MALKDKPGSPSFLNPNGFELLIRRLPFTNFYCQKVTLPEIRVEPIMVPNPYNRLNYSASAPTYSSLIVDFKVDENLKNYREIANWLKGLGFPETYDQYSENKKVHGNDALRSDASLIFTTSSKVPNIEFRLVDVFPIRLSLPDAVASSTKQEVEYVTATAEFSVRDFDVVSINECDPE
jgi:hypothetical protein